MMTMLSKTELASRRMKLKAQRTQVTAGYIARTAARAEKIREVAAKESVSSVRAAAMVDGLIKRRA